MAATIEGIGFSIPTYLPTSENHLSELGIVGNLQIESGKEVMNHRDQCLLFFKQIDLYDVKTISDVGTGFAIPERFRTC